MANSYRINQIKQVIESIDSKLDAGLTSTSSDGLTASISPTALRKRRAELQAELDRLEGTTTELESESGGFRRITGIM